MLMYKVVYKKAPLYLQQLFSESNLTYNLRASDGRLALPKPRTEYLKSSFSYSGAKLWNTLPDIARKAKTIAEFKKELNQFFQ